MYLPHHPSPASTPIVYSLQSYTLLSTSWLCGIVHAVPSICSHLIPFSSASLSYNSLPLLSHPFFNLYSKLKLFYMFSFAALLSPCWNFFLVIHLFLVMEHVSYLCTPQCVAQHMTCYALNALEILFLLMNTLSVPFTTYPEFKAHTTPQLRTSLPTYRF